MPADLSVPRCSHPTRRRYATSLTHVFSRQHKLELEWRVELALLKGLGEVGRIPVEAHAEIQKVVDCEWSGAARVHAAAGTPRPHRARQEMGRSVTVLCGRMNCCTVTPGEAPTANVLTPPAPLCHRPAPQPLSLPRPTRSRRRNAGAHTGD
jgi:hypothetical protein